MSEDESVRDFKKSLKKHVSNQAQFRTKSEQLAESDLLHPDIGRPSDIAQPGGFRRNHLVRNSSPGASLEIVQRSLLESTTMCLPGVLSSLDPRIRLFFEEEDKLSSEGGESAPSMRGSSDLTTAITIIKSSVGGTLLVLPAAFMGPGIVMAVALLFSLGGVEVYCMVLLVRCSRELGGASYSDLAQETLGMFGAVAVDTSLVLSQIGFVCCEMLYVARNLHGAFEAMGILPWLSVSSMLWLHILLVAPLSWIRRLEYFKVSNAIANFTVLSCVVLIAGLSCVGLFRQGAGSDVVLFGSGWLTFSGTAVFCFECINFVLPMYDAHENKETFIPVLVYTLGGVALLFASFGSMAYICYGANTKPIITLNLADAGVASLHTPILLVFAFSCLLSEPLFIFPVSVFFESKMFERGPPNCKRKWKKNFLRTFLVVLCTVLSIMAADSILALVALVGSFCCVPLAFIYPALMHWRLFKPSLRQAAVDFGIIALGFALFVITTITALDEWGA